MEPEYKFNPSKQLLDFAKFFSDNYKTLMWGDYYSSDKKYHINYVETIIDDATGEILTPVRVGHNTGIIDISRSKILSGRRKIFYLVINIC